DSSEQYDRGSKFHKYCSLPSFKEYVLISQHRPVVDVLFRQEKTYWRMTTTIGLDKSIYLNNIACEIPMEEIYRGCNNLLPPLVEF
ncbi:MAG: Uma2 family endonuclease, partial [Bacteroidota bacterium]